MIGEQRRLQFTAQPKDESLLPDIYFQLTAIEGNNISWVTHSIGSLYNQSLCIESDLEILEWNTNKNTTLFGSSMGSYGALAVVATTEEPICKMHQGKGISSVAFNTLSKGRHIYSMYYTHLDVDGEVFATYNYEYTLIRLGIMGNEWLTCPHMRVYHMIIKDDNVVYYDFYPCYRKADSAIGMYDVVNGIFVSNNKLTIVK